MQDTKVKQSRWTLPTIVYCSSIWTTVSTQSSLFSKLHNPRPLNTPPLWLSIMLQWLELSNNVCRPQLALEIWMLWVSWWVHVALFRTASLILCATLKISRNSLGLAQSDGSAYLGVCIRSTERRPEGIVPIRLFRGWSCSGPIKSCSGIACTIIYNNCMFYADDTRLHSRNLTRAAIWNSSWERRP